MSRKNSVDVVRSRSVSLLEEDLGSGIGKSESGSYKDRVRVNTQTTSKGPSSSSTLVSKKISSRPTTPSGGKRKACIVHLDGCRYTIVASPPELTSTDTRTDMTSTTMTTSVSDTKDTALPRSGSLTLLEKTTSDGSIDGGGARATESTSCPDTSSLSNSTASNSTTAAAATDRSPRSVSTRKTPTVGWNRDGKKGETATPSGTMTSCELDGMEKLSMVDSTLVPNLCSFRLRHLLAKLNQDDVEKDDVIRNLEYVIRLLDSAFAEGLRNDADDDDEEQELNRVETEAVPNEVREWLAMTFTRSNHSAIKRRVNDKPKFRSVANAIRAGILVDRIYRRVSSNVGRQVPAKIATSLKRVDEWSFDVFALDEVSEGHALRYIGYDLLQRYDLINKFKMITQTVDCLLGRLEQGYSKYANPYHNIIHAADVTQTMHHVISRSGLLVWLTDIDILAAILAALIHDFEHTGTTNTFQINTSSEMALVYNDKAVLENHHVSAVFRLLKDDDCNIVSNLKTEEYREFRSLVIDMVLATDMSSHFQQIKNMKAMISLRESVDKTKALSLIVHCADISHPAKTWELHHRWTELLIEEFFRQGDREASLGLQISPLCDRKNTLVAESQIGFIDYIVDPSLQVMGDMIERIVEENSSSEDTRTTAKTTTTTTTSSALYSTKAKRMSNKTVSSQGKTKFHITREWEECLVINKHLWKERSEKGWMSPLQGD